MRTSGIIALVVLLVVIVAGYFGYEYVKRKPPSWLIALVATPSPPPPLPTGEPAPFSVPDGFTATIYSRETPGARVMTRDPRGTLVVSLTREGKIVALPDEDADGRADGTFTILEGLRQPHGIFFTCDESGSCFLYVAETDAVKRYAYDADTRTATYEETLLSVPSGGGHYTRTLLPHPDNRTLLVSIGSSCNVCEEQNPMRASIWAIDLATGATSSYATGLRNSVFMAVHPVTGEVWATDNGRDLIGDDIPPDEVNIIREGRDYGWPICYGKNVHDTDFDSRQYFRDPCADKEPSHIDLQAHSAALGIVFVPEEGWPEDLWHDALIAYHGSWNRSVPTGYKVVRFDLTNEGNPVRTTPLDFMTGFLPEGARTDDALGRPAGLLIEPGGVLYVSDDHAGAVYRVMWRGE